MLSQLTHLSVEADGRYATAGELQFLRNYIDSFEDRISAYEKIKDAEDKIIQEVASKMEKIDPTLFFKGSRDVSSTCKRDRVYILRHLALAVLLNDMDRLRDSLLLWYQTILRCFKNEQASEVTHQVLKEIVPQYLTPKETNLFVPVVDLSRSLLSK